MTTHQTPVTPRQTPTDALVQEAQTKRHRIATSIWPRARVLGEILYHQVERDQLFTQASALTYKTLFSLLPVFVLALLVLSTISAGDGANAFDKIVRDKLFEQMGIDKLTITTTPTTQGAETAGPATQQAVKLSAYIDPMIRTAKEQVTSRATGLVAFAVLLYGAISLMIVIESTFNRIYGSVKPRSWPRRIMLYWCVLTLGPIGLAASIVLANSAYTAATSVAGAAPAVVASSTVLSFLKIFSGFMVSWVLILLLYRLVPGTRVNWRAAAVGAFVAAVSWELGKWGFGLYVQKTAAKSFYGSLALLPLFMFWIYITWSLVLIGLEITYVQQYWPLLKRQFFFSRATPPGAPVVSDLRWVLAIGVLVYKDFKAGRKTEVHEAAEKLMLPNDILHLLLEAMEAGGIVHEIHQGGGTYVLARPAETITAHDLLTAARGLCQVPPELAKEVAHVSTYPTSEAVRRLEELEGGWARANTLPQLAGDA